VRGGLSPLSGLICLEELLLPKKSMFIESKALISSFHCNPDGVPQADVAISFSVSSGKSLEVRDVTDLSLIACCQCRIQTFR